jgi:hypothetical protein
MKRIAVCVPGLFLVSLAIVPLVVPLSAQQDVRVTAGSLTFEAGVGHIAIRGTSDFRMDSIVDIAGGVFDPENQCEGVDCPPGTVVNLGAVWTGSDLRGKARLGGRDYVLGSESTQDGAEGIAEFAGSLTLPDFGDADTVSVTAPFTFSGQLTPQTTFPFETTQLSGAGIATLDFARDPLGIGWDFVRATYAFDRQPTATTEH